MPADGRWDLTRCSKGSEKRFPQHTLLNVAVSYWRVFRSLWTSELCIIRNTDILGIRIEYCMAYNICIIECRYWELATGWAGRDSNPGRGNRLKRPDRLWGPPNLLFNGYRGAFPGVNWQGREVDRSPLFSAEAYVCCHCPYVLRLFTYINCSEWNKPGNRRAVYASQFDSNRKMQQV